MRHAGVGGLGIFPLYRNAKILCVTQACRMLSADDQVVASIALTHLNRAVAFAGGNPSTEEGLTRFMGGDALEPQERGLTTATTRMKISSLWMDARRSLTHLRAQLNFADNKVQKIARTVHYHRYDDDSIARTEEFDFPPRLSVYKLRDLERTEAASAWASKSTSGHVSRCLATDQLGTHSRFYWTGQGLSFCQRRFAFQARLNAVPVRTRRARWTKSGAPAPARTCRICGEHVESLCHLLCHCWPLMQVITARHNVVLKWLVDALPPAKHVLVGQEPLRGLSHLKPDLTVFKANDDDQTNSAPQTININRCKRPWLRQPPMLPLTTAADDSDTSEEGSSHDTDSHGAAAIPNRSSVCQRVHRTHLKERTIPKNSSCMFPGGYFTVCRRLVLFQPVSHGSHEQPALRRHGRVRAGPRAVECASRECYRSKAALTELQPPTTNFY